MDKFDFYKNKKIFFGISIVIILAGIVWYFINGLQLDVQFVGGFSLEIVMADDKFNPNDAINLVRDTIGKEATALKLSTYNPDKPSDKLDMLKIQIAKTEGELNSTEINKLTKALEDNKKFNVAPNSKMNMNSISPTIGTELRNRALLALLISSLLIVLYIAFRFRKMSGFTAGITAVIALLHDVGIMIAVYSIFSVPVNENFVAAMLTVLGYSINDTIIIYDRIRENMNRLRKVEIPELINISIWETMGRSINTLVTTLICIVTLYVFASIYNIESIKQFSFPLIVGLTSGGYSSIFVASPLWVIWKTRSAKHKAAKKGKKARAV